MVKSNPLVSVLMPSFQQVAFIQDAVNSVIAQTHQNWELLIQDGGSTDGTCELLSELAGHDSRIRWVTQSDAGPADALNRALSRRRGTVIAWLNSDDLLSPDAFATAVEHFSSHPSHLMVYGHGEHIDEQGETLKRYPTVHVDDWVLSPSMTCQICQPTVMFKHSLVAMLGAFDTSLKTAFDFEYWLRVLRCFPGRIGFIDQVRAKSRLHGATITSKQRDTVALEGLRVVHRHVGSVDPHWLISWIQETFGTQGVASESARQHADKVLSCSGPWISPVLIDQLRAKFMIPRLER